MIIDSITIGKYEGQSRSSVAYSLKNKQMREKILNEVY